MEQDKKPNGAIVGLIIIVTLLIVGGIYVWQAKVKSAIEAKKAADMQASQNSTGVTAGDSTDLNNLSNDLNNTDTNVGVDVNTLK